MPGYNDQILHLDFSHLGDGSELLWAAIRNPQLQPPDALRPADVPLGPDGKPINPDDAVDAMYAIIAGLIVAWRLYAADVEVTVDEETGEAVVGEPERMPTVNKQNPATPAMIKRLPMAVITEISQRIRQGTNPQ